MNKTREGIVRSTMDKTRGDKKEHHGQDQGRDREDHSSWEKPGETERRNMNKTRKGIERIINGQNQRGDREKHYEQNQGRDREEHPCTV